jgi:uncharacterized protein YndB with AHSA1/START domain
MTATDTSITMTQLVPAPPARVYAAWVDPEMLATWWWPQLADTTYDLDARVGGSYRIRSELAGMGVHGTFVALDEPHRLELTWVWEDGASDGPEERVVVDLVAEGQQTRVTVRHALVDDAGADDFRQGWTDCLARLGRGEQLATGG